MCSSDLALEDAARYANQRIAFGKPIARQEMIQELLTDMEIKVQKERTPRSWSCHDATAGVALNEIVSASLL